MRILLIGNSYSSWTLGFLNNVLITRDDSIFLLNSNYDNRLTGSENTGGRFSIILPATISPIMLKIPKLRAVFIHRKQVEAISKYAPFDIIIVMFVNIGALFSAVSLKRKNGSKIFAYFCGSDIIRNNRLSRLVLRKTLKLIDCSVLASNSVLNSYMHLYSGKSSASHVVIRLGLSVLDYITSERFKTGEENCRRFFGIEKDRVTICIGYNGSQAQNHIPVLEVIKDLPNSIKRKIIILLPLTYGGSSKYISKITDSVKATGCGYLSLNKYLSYTEIARLWLSTDIFINAQTTDGLSGSVIEAAYAGATIINASWLRYDEFIGWGIDYLEFADYNVLKKVIQRIIDNPNIQHHIDRDIIYRNMSWQNCNDKWRELIKCNRSEF